MVHVAVMIREELNDVPLLIGWQYIQQVGCISPEPEHEHTHTHAHCEVWAQILEQITANTPNGDNDGVANTCIDTPSIPTNTGKVSKI